MSDTAPHLTTLPTSNAISIREHVPMAALGDFFGRAFGALAARAADKMAGPPFAIYHAIDADDVDVEAAVPVRAQIDPVGSIHPITVEGGAAVEVRHTGPWNTVGEAYNAIAAWMQDHHYTRGAAPREIYLSDPSVPEKNRVTVILQPVTPS